MRSIDKLREWANGLHGVYVNKVDHTITVTTGWDAPPDMDSVNLRDHVNGILDGIEQEVADMRGFCERLDDAATKREDVTLWGVDYTPYPLDADGVPIHVGDVMDEQLPFGGYAAPAPVDTMELSRGAGGYGWMVRLDSESGAFINPKLLRHHHAPTVEDVLEEFVARWMETHHDDIPALKAEYAARLRLAGDE